MNRLSIVLAAIALAVSLFGSTPLGEAAGSAVIKYAQTAGFAKNAGKVNGIKASRTPRSGMLLALGADGKFPLKALPLAAAGSTGPAGAKGDKGDKGDKGIPASPTTRS